MFANVYETSDLNEAVILKYFAYKLESVDRTSKRAIFSFRKDDGFEDVLRGYRERKLQVEPYFYSQCIKDVKDRLYNG